MYKIFFLLIGLSFFFKSSRAQATDDKIIYVVDSIVVMDDPEQGNEILQTDVADMTIIKNRDTLDRLGYKQFDGAAFIFTKEYKNRPDSLKRIPSSKQMKRKAGVWYRGDVPYTGRFIDYYYSGRKRGQGTMVEGKLNGFHTTYYQNGKIKVERTYEGGIENGLDKEYYEDGSLKQKGEFKNGKEEGIWQDYYPNGQVKMRGKYRDGEIFDSATTYYSTGKIKEVFLYKNGEEHRDPAQIKLDQLMSRSKESYHAGNKKAAVKYCTKAIEIDSTFAQAYFSRGTLHLNDFEFDEAIADFDKGLQFEPYMNGALANRAFARIRKYQFASSRTLSQSNDVKVMASADKVAIPDEEKQKICTDLQKAVLMGDKTEMIIEALSDYCQ